MDVHIVYDAGHYLDFGHCHTCFVGNGRLCVDYMELLALIYLGMHRDQARSDMDCLEHCADCFPPSVFWVATGTAGGYHKVACGCSGDIVPVAMGGDVGVVRHRDMTLLPSSAVDAS